MRLRKNIDSLVTGILAGCLKKIQLRVRVVKEVDGAQSLNLLEKIDVLEKNVLVKGNFL